MSKFKKSFALTYILVVLATLVFTFFIYNKPAKFVPPEQKTNFSYEFIHGEIAQIDTFSETGPEKFIVEANSGKEDGEKIIVNLNPLNNYNTYVIGDEILVYKGINNETNETTYEITDYYHQNGLIYIFIIFAIITIIIARKKGVTAILSILISLFLFYFIFLKMIASGINPLISVVIFVLIITALTVPLIHGFNKKSLSAIISIFIGYIASLGVIFLFKELAQIGSAPGEEFRMLAIMYPNVGLSDILIASLFMGAIGALIDTAISIASAVFEAIEEKNHSFKKVFSIGMAVGKDVLGSMTNTLLFAYLASALPFFVLLTFSQSGQGDALSELVNMDFIALELTRTFIGAVSLVLLIPLVAGASAYFLVKNKS